LEDLDYAGDICFLAKGFCNMEEKLKRLNEEAELAGLQIAINKTKGMRVNRSNMQKNFGQGKRKLKKLDPLYT